MHRRRLAALPALLAALACAGAGAALPGIGCNGTGTTPVCNFPDGADDPEAGCGELIEAAAPDASDEADTGTGEDSSVNQSEGGQADTGAADTAAPPVVDSGHDAGSDSASAKDSGDAGEIDSAIADANHDAHG